MAGWLEAGIWGWVSGAALIVGALLGYGVRLPTRLIAGIMAFGSGVLISALSFDLMDEAQRRGGLLACSVGFLLGATLFTLANLMLARRGAGHRKRSTGHQPSEQEVDGSGAAIAVGALMDGIPESIVIGTTLLAGGHVSKVAVIAIFLSNLPEGLSSAAGMKRAGRSPLYVLGLWLSIAFVSGCAAIAGYTLFQHAAPALISTVTSLAAGAMLAMLVDTMMPEAFAASHALSGLITVAGFLAAFALSKLDAPAHAAQANDSHHLSLLD